MSETAPVRAVLLGHGSLPQGMVDAVQRITGAEPGCIVPLSNSGMGPEALAAEIEQALGHGPGIVFTDLPSGSCGFVARKLAHGRPGIAVVSGVNLPVLIDFVMNCSSLSLDALLPRLLDRGRAGLGCTQAVPEANERRPVSG
jgi:mannose PTS system EIIA component